METLILKPEVIDQIKADADLFGKVALALGISAYTLPAYLRRNDLRLTQATPLQAISEYLNVKDTDLLVPVANPQTAA